MVVVENYDRAVRCVQYTLRPNVCQFLLCCWWARMSLNVWVLILILVIRWGGALGFLMVPVCTWADYISIERDLGRCYKFRFWLTWLQIERRRKKAYIWVLKIIQSIKFLITATGHIHTQILLRIWVRFYTVHTRKAGVKIPWDWITQIS